jgi:hypothetical protein
MHLQPPDLIPPQMTRHQQDGPHYRISTMTCPFLRLPVRADLHRLGSIWNWSQFVFSASCVNLDPSTRPNGMSKPLLKDLRRMSERIVLHIFDFIIVTCHIANSETASTGQDFLFSIDHLRRHPVCLSSDPHGLFSGFGFRYSVFGLHSITC